MKKLIGGSKQIQQVHAAIGRLASSGTNIVITGEPGTGKSVVAELLHETGVNTRKPFVKLDVAGIDEIRLRSIVQSILSSQEFLNPVTSDHGNFHLPDGATLIMDEVDSSSIPAQSIIADFIDGMSTSVAKIRLILLLSDAVRNLVKKEKILPVLAKLTRQWDTIHMPSLRERVEDIPDLIEHFVLETAREMALGDIVIDVNAVAVLVRKEWKGNVRELKTFIERAMLLSENKETFMLPETLLDEQSEVAQMLERIDQGVEFAIDRSMELIEKRILERVLRKFEFNQSRAARFLRITEDTLRYRMKKLGIHNVQHP
ncbi:MAG: sigma-54-dependent Fis family transcriptional regulator [Ignavibacteriales bacterium]|nr:sigma-54-dependent Fis family transcriptional regulator [Ignavibacteriales bacterium]